MRDRSRKSGEERMNATALHVVRDAAEVIDSVDPPSSGLVDMRPDYDIQRSLEDAQWIGAAAVRVPWFGCENTAIHPNYLRSVAEVLEGRQWRHSIADGELRITYNLAGANESERVAAFAKSLGRLIGSRHHRWGVFLSIDQVENAAPNDGSSCTVVDLHSRNMSAPPTA